MNFIIELLFTDKIVYVYFILFLLVGFGYLNKLAIDQTKRDNEKRNEKLRKYFTSI